MLGALVEPMRKLPPFKTNHLRLLRISQPNLRGHHFQLCLAPLQAYSAVRSWRSTSSASRIVRKHPGDPSNGPPDHDCERAERGGTQRAQAPARAKKIGGALADRGAGAAEVSELAAAREDATQRGRPPPATSPPGSPGGGGPRAACGIDRPSRGASSSRACRAGRRAAAPRGRGRPGPRRRDRLRPRRPRPPRGGAWPWRRAALRGRAGRQTVGTASAS